MNTHKRYNGTCPACKTTHSVLARPTTEYVRGSFQHGNAVSSGLTVFETEDGFKLGSVTGSTIARTCECGREISLKPVRGRYVKAHKCDARCVNSKGHVCDCSCGGKNHGSGYTFA